MNHLDTESKQQNNSKQLYIPPQVTSYSTETLQAQLGPARAFTPSRSIDEELFGDDY